MLDDLIKEAANRRDVFKKLGATALGAALLADAGFDPAMAQALAPGAKPMKAAFSNAGLQATWCAQGKQAAEAWGKLMNVEVTWFDGELSATKQRAAIDNMASQKWDFVAIQTFGIGTLTDPIKKMIDEGTPVIAMDTLVAPPGTVPLQTFIAPDNIMMGSVVTNALVKAMGGAGNMVMTQGALGEFNVPLPADLTEWLQVYADEHYEPEPKKRRRPIAAGVLYPAFGLLLSPVVVGLFWKLIYDPSWGILNYALGLGKTAWLTDTNLALYAVAITDIWMWSPFVMLLSLAGLSAVPKHLYEAASIDRASKLYTFFRITLPLVAPILMIAVIFRTMEAFKTFDIAFVMTGQPQAELISSRLYKMAFAQWQTGPASALAYIILIMVLCITNIYVKYLNKAKER